MFVKLLRNGIGGPFYQVIKSMYKSVTASIKCGSLLSDQFNIYRGVKQGDVLSPLLFNIFINDLITPFNNAESCPPSLLSKKVGCLLYADDLVILSTSKEGLQSSLDHLSSYCKKWKLSVNHSKSKVMCLSKQGKLDKTEFRAQGQCLNEVSSYPYLGLEMTNSGSFKLAQKTLTNKAMKALFKLKHLLYGSNLNPNVCLQLFDQLIKPICLYGAEIWGPIEVHAPSSLENKWVASVTG